MHSFIRSRYPNSLHFNIMVANHIILMNLSTFEICSLLHAKTWVTLNCVKINGINIALISVAHSVQNHFHIFFGVYHQTIQDIELKLQETISLGKLISFLYLLRSVAWRSTALLGISSSRIFDQTMWSFVLAFVLHFSYQH